MVCRSFPRPYKTVRQFSIPFVPLVLSLLNTGMAAEYISIATHHRISVRGATQNFREFEYTAQTISATTCAARCILLYLSTVSQPTGVFVIARVSAFWLFSLHHFHVCLLISKWRMLRSKEFALNFASSSTKLQLKPTQC